MIGAKVIATAFADLGFRRGYRPAVSNTGGSRPPSGRKRCSRDRRQLAGGRSFDLVPELRAALAELGREDIMIVVGGVIPLKTTPL